MATKRAVIKKSAAKQYSIFVGFADGKFYASENDYILGVEGVAVADITELKIAIKNPPTKQKTAIFLGEITLGN